MTQHFDIAIVGAGLVGASLANLIAQAPENQDLKIALLDQGDAPILFELNTNVTEYDARVVALTPRSIQLMETIGSWSQVNLERVCAYQHMQVWDNEGTAYINFDATELKQPSLGTIIENSLLSNAILRTLEQYPAITLLWHHQLTAIDDLAKYKQLHFHKQGSLTANLVVAADGGQSRVRELLSMPTRTWRYNHKAIVTTVETEHPHERSARQNFLSTGPLAFLPLGHPSGCYSSIVWSAEDKYSDELMGHNDEIFNRHLANAFEHRLGKILQTGKRYCFPLVQRHALSYSMPQVALVGDAAHTIHPLAGQGVNLGLQDALSLANEISRASQRKLDISDFSILRRYERQRKRHNLEAMLLMEGFKQLFGNRSLSIRWLRNTGLAAVNRSNWIKNWLAKQAMGINES